MKYLNKFDSVSQFQDWANGDAPFNVNTVPFTVVCLDTGNIVYHEYVNMSNPYSYDYVDLGLPSGTLWATMNLGASNLKDIGSYYSWGSFYTGSGNSFSLSNYDEKNYDQNNARLSLADDVANDWFGGGWHIPTVDQCAELLDNRLTSISQTTIGTSLGVLVSSLSNSNSIFLPFTGYYDGDTYGNSLQGGETLGYYWSIDLQISSEWNNGVAVSYDYSRANTIYLTSNDGCWVGSLPRYCGCPIRPVLGDRNYQRPQQEVS